MLYELTTTQMRLHNMDIRTLRSLIGFSTIKNYELKDMIEVLMPILKL